jgi:hypothetical protein
LFNTPVGNANLYGMAIANGTLYLAGYGSGPFLLTVNTQ